MKTKNTVQSAEIRFRFYVVRFSNGARMTVIADSGKAAKATASVLVVPTLHQLPAVSARLFGRGV